MSRDQQRLLDYLEHILIAIQRIEGYVSNITEITFLNNSLIQDAVIRNIEIIGEASNKVQTRYADFAEEHADLPFSQAYQMRNAVAHGYFKVDMDIVWKTIQSDLPDLYSRVNLAYQALKSRLDEA
jgi:uncharacterized protein with HEPN domain